MHRLLTLLVFALLAASLTGCGNDAPETAPIDFESPAVNGEGDIRPAFECGGGSLWLPLEWGPVPDDTEELAVYMGRFKYEEVQGARELTVPFGILVSKIEPSVRRIPANTLPEGAAWSYFGQNCLPERNGQKILQVLFALDRTWTRELTKPLATRLTEEALRFGGSTGSSRSLDALGEATIGRGQFVAVYAP